MAHGGHHSHSHHHHHHYHGSGSVSGVEIAILIVAIIVLLFIEAIASDISGKKPLEGTYETYSSYVIDKEEYFSNTNELISGLKNLHEKTNIQIVVMSSRDSWSDCKVEEKYYEMFDDEAHILLVIPAGWFSSTEYYAIGELANTVIGDREIDYLLDDINGSSDGSKWNKKLNDFTERLLFE